jgi:hypothetical protein
MGSYKPGVGLKFGEDGDEGAPANEAEGKRPSDPGMTLDWSERLQHGQINHFREHNPDARTCHQTSSQ